MRRRGFFALNDDSFWGIKGDSESNVSDGEVEKEKEKHIEIDNIEAITDKGGEWIDVRSTTPSKRFQQSRGLRRNQMLDVNRAAEAHASLLNRHDFTTLDVLKTVCRELGPARGCTNGGFAKPTYSPSVQADFKQHSPPCTSPNGFVPLPQTADRSGFGAGLGRFMRPDLKKDDGDAQPNRLRESGDCLAAADESGFLDDMAEALPMMKETAFDLAQPIRPPHTPQAATEKKRFIVNLLDEQYVEYYESLCIAIRKLFESGIPLKFDCDTSTMSAPYTSTICRALKSKFYHQHNPGPETYSRKVFVGGLPIDIDEDELMTTFRTFGPLVVDWPNKHETKSYFPPKGVPGYVFLIFNFEMSVKALVHSCFSEDEKLFFYIARPKNGEKLVQIRPWRLADADYLVDVNVPINPRRVVFVGGVPRPIRAVELAHIMDTLYGSVSCAGIDTDVEYKYPKGAGRVAFSSYASYMRAITDRYAQLSHGEVEKRVEMKPYVLDDQTCEECRVNRAPFFCPHLECLQYYCETCWTQMHGCLSREDHKPLVKEA